ncbi:hypothetical protein GQ53DRAFT_204198 [Thozetella sp. PMI_491]|nr:hypothetical protein GQ53DRAFT_204198 [Thozetella sp. PMI_491]
MPFASKPRPKCKLVPGSAATIISLRFAGSAVLVSVTERIFWVRILTRLLALAHFLVASQILNPAGFEYRKWPFVNHRDFGESDATSPIPQLHCCQCTRRQVGFLRGRPPPKGCLGRSRT